MFPARRTFYKVIGLFFLIWILIILQINNVLRFQTIPELFQNSDYVRIGYFKKYYINSMPLDNQNKEGYMGKGVLPLINDSIEKERLYELHKFNEVASSRIPILRKLPEKRNTACLVRTYKKLLPTASIIIIYHNEAFSTLTRTVHTALSRSPYHIIKELILVDDFSDYEKFPHLLAKLDDHFRNNHKIKIIRSEKRIGLVNARIVGAKLATGKVLVFLDSHCECFEGWLEPLLLTINEHPNIAVSPIIEIINSEDFAINPSPISVINVGTFSWKADFRWVPVKHTVNYSDIIRSPTLSGGLFAINKDYFFRIGSYDEKMTYWGGENLEMSFRLWMCGGGVYMNPCSIVGHVFREKSPHNINYTSILYNKLRVIEVWMDEYKNESYSRLGLHGYDENAGSLLERIELRKNLECKSFDWYVKSFPEYIRLPGNVTSIRNPMSNYCFDTMGTTSKSFPLRLYKCHNGGGNQFFEMISDGAILHDSHCLQISDNRNETSVDLSFCDVNNLKSEWSFSNDRSIKSVGKGLCLEANLRDRKVVLSKCSSGNPLQKWDYNRY